MRPVRKNGSGGRGAAASVSVSAMVVAAFGCVLVLLAGCSTTVQGNATAAGQTGAPGGEQYSDLLAECAIVPTDTIAQIVGAAGVVETFSGAVCRWRSIDGAIDVQLDWFETGAMGREKSVAENLGYNVENVRISGDIAYVLRPPDDPAACGAVAGAGDAGIVGWWVHSAPADPCEAAKKLVELSINRAL